MTAGLVAREMGLPVDVFLSANNINDAVPGYLSAAFTVASKRGLSLANTPLSIRLS